MTRRSILLGLMGAVFICGFAFFSDRILQQGRFVGHLLPASIYGVLVLFILFLNPRLRRWSLTGRELAVVLTLTLAAASIPGAGLMRTFNTSLILPHHYNRFRPGWREQQVVEMVPEKMLVDISEDPDIVLDGFVMGLRVGGRQISFGDVPWFAWVRTFRFWLPLILTLWIALLALALVLHRQWSRHEHLPYPIAEFTNKLLPEPGKVNSSLFRNRLFWIGVIGVFLLYLNNYMYRWFPEYLIFLPTRLPFRPLGALFPLLVDAGGLPVIFRPYIFFTVIGIAFLIPKNISLSFGIGPFFWFLGIGIFALYGIDLGKVHEGASSMTGVQVRPFVLFGANLGVFLTLLYTGRHYYRKVLSQSMGLLAGKEADVLAVWGCRIFLGLMGLFIWQLTRTGLDWQLSLLFTVILVILYVVMSRLIAETGLLHAAPHFYPCVIIWGLFGARVIGPSTLLILQLVSLIFVIAPNIAIMPLMANSFKLLELRRVKLGRISRISVLAIVLGLAIAIPMTLWIQYDHGNTIWGWAEVTVPVKPFDNVVEVTHRLSAQGLLETSEQFSGWERFGAIFPHPVAMGSLLAGLGLVLLFTVARLRFRWWPLHPLLFVTWGTWSGMRMGGSFMIGWLIKVLVVKYGGSKLYNKLKPLMIGLIIGELLASVIPMIVGAIYYFVTGNTPVSFTVF